MIDFHSHIIYDVDDGAEAIENSIKILEKAQEVGFESVVLTPHYMEDYYECNAEEINQKIKELEKICYEKDINIKLYQGNEVYITNYIVELINNKKATTINNSKYVLFELPMNNEPPNLLEVIYKLLENGNIPIIAHPERYTYIQKEPNKLFELVENGVLFQANYGSILGQYGKEVQKTVKLLIQNNYIHFLGTDVHKTGHIYENINQVKEQLQKLISEDKIEELTKINAEKVLKNEKIEIELPYKIKQGFFKKLFS